MDLAPEARQVLARLLTELYARNDLAAVALHPDRPAPDPYQALRQLREQRLALDRLCQWAGLPFPDEGQAARRQRLAAAAQPPPGFQLDWALAVLVLLSVLALVWCVLAR